MDAFCGRASAFSKASFVLLFPALGLQCAGLGTIAWMKTKTVSYSTVLVIGLWKVSNCTGSYDTICVESGLPASYGTTLLTVTRALEFMSLTFMVLSLVLSAAYVTSPGARVQAAAAFLMMFCFIATVFNVGGTVAWLQNIPTNHYVYWSMGLALIAASFSLLSGVLMIPDIRYYDYEGVKRKAEERRERKRKRKEAMGTANLIN